MGWFCEKICKKENCVSYDAAGVTCPKTIADNKLKKFSTYIANYKNKIMTRGTVATAGIASSVLLLTTKKNPKIEKDNLERGKNKLNWKDVDTGVKIDIENPMKHLSDEVKLGDITQVMAHDALCLDGLMLWGFNNCAACQYVGLTEQAKCGVTMFDVRLKKNNDYRWAPYHGKFTAKIDALKEIVSLIEHARKHPESVYIIRFKINVKHAKLFFDDLEFELGKAYNKKLKLKDILLTPKDFKTNISIVDLTLGEIRKIRKNIIISFGKEEDKSEVPEVVHNFCFVKQSTTAFDHKSQSSSAGNQMLADAVVKNISKKQKAGRFLFATPAHTFNLWYIKTSYFSPLRDAKDNNNDITWRVLDQLYSHQYKLQAYGLNGIIKVDKCINDIFKYSDACIFNIYGKKGFKQ